MKLLLASTFEKFGDKIEKIPNLNLSKKSVLCITTAANVEKNTNWLDAELYPIRKRSKTFEIYDIADKSESALQNKFADFDVIYMSGGNTYYLLEKIKNSGFENVLRNKLNQGAYFFGSSAGAVVTCPRIDFIGNMDDPSKASLNNYKGMSLVNYLILPHFDHPSYGGEAEKIFESLSNSPEKVMTLKDNQAIYVQDNDNQIF